MKRNLLTALALTAGLSALASNYYGQGTPVTVSASRRNLMANYIFNCTAVATVNHGEEVINHTIQIDGALDANRRTLAGNPVFVSVNGRIFAKYNLPQHSIWVKDGELIALSLRGLNVKGEGFKMRYAGEGNLAQNRIEVGKKRRTLYTDDLSCTLTPSR